MKRLLSTSIFAILFCSISYSQNPQGAKAGQQYRKDQLQALEGVMGQLNSKDIDIESLKQQLIKAQQQMDAMGNQQPSTYRPPQPAAKSRNRPLSQKSLAQQSAPQNYQPQPSPRRNTAQQNFLGQPSASDQNMDLGAMQGLLKGFLPPRVYKLVSVVTDKRVTMPLKEIHFTNQKLKLMLILQILVILIMIVVRHSANKSVRTIFQAIGFNLFSMLLFWVLSVGIIPTIVYGNNYALLLKGLFLSIRDIT